MVRVVETSDNVHNMLGHLNITQPSTDYPRVESHPSSESWTDQTLYNMTKQHDDMRNEFVEIFVGYATIIVSIPGGIGNAICLSVMLKAPFKEMPHSIMCAALAFVDLAYLLLSFSVSLVLIMTGEPIGLINGFLCKLSMSFLYLCTHLDAFIIVGLSLERVVAIFWALQAKQILTKRRIKLFLVIIFTFFILFDGETSVRYDLVEMERSGGFMNDCAPAYFYGVPRKLLEMKDQMSFLLGSTIPLIIIITSNVAILIKLAHRRKQQTQLGVNNDTSDKTRTTKMLIAVMLAFILFVSPIQVYAVAVGVNLNDKVLRILAFLMVLNPAINFILYFLAAKMFREAVKDMFSFRCIEARQTDGVNNHVPRSTCLAGVSSQTRRVPAHPKEARF